MTVLEKFGFVHAVSLLAALAIASEKAIVYITI